MAALIIAGFLIVIGISIALFFNFSPEFGGKSSDDQKAAFAKIAHFEGGKFHNLISTSMDMDFATAMSVLADRMKGNTRRRPDRLMPFVKIDSLDIGGQPRDKTRITWFGHSTILIEIDGQTLLIDPVFSPKLGPNHLVAPKRFSSALPIAIEHLSHIDAVIISHDHYDHLDYRSIQKLNNKVDQFYMPLGVGAHFLSWGISPQKIHELDWWEEINHGDLRLICTPARHFSGRGLTDRWTTLWASWIIQSTDQNIYFSGDSGYGPHFKEIGEKYGPFDFAMMECGQYDRRWATIHMMPEQTVQAALDLDARLMMPIHWGAFSLALHSWDDPILRISAEAKRLGQPIATPKIGQGIVLGDRVTYSAWWEKLSP